MAEKIIFVKYSNTRSEKYKIKTIISLDENSNKKVRKYPMNRDAYEHICNMVKNYQALTCDLKNSKINIVKPIITEEFLEYPFIDGNDLNSLIDEAWELNGVKGIINEINGVINIFQDTWETHKFEISDDFISVFGDVVLENEMRSFVVSNIDLLFSNIILKDSKFNIFDYEWVFNFDIPVNYIFYRMIYNYCHYRNLSAIPYIDEIFKSLQISDLDNFKKMDRNFNKYVNGIETDKNIKEFPLKTIINPYDFIEQIEKRDFIQCFYSDKNQFSESDSYIHYTSLNTGRKRDVIDIRISNCKNLRIDLFEVPLKVRIINIIIKLVDDRTIEPEIYRSNAEFMENDIFCFLNNDAQIYFDFEQCIEIKKIEIEYEILVINPDSRTHFNSIINQKDDMIKEQSRAIQEKENLLKEQSRAIQEKENLLKEQSRAIQEKENLLKEQSRLIQEQEQEIKKIYNLKIMKVWKLINRIVN